jgi:hypothetical protein
MVLILAGELLKKAENVLVMGLHPSEVIKGYELASTKALAELESLFSATLLLLLWFTKIVDRVIHHIFTFSTDTCVPLRCAKTLDCLKAIRSRRYASILGSRSCTCRYA